MNKRFPLHVKIVLYLVLPSLFGIVSIFFGKDSNWDLRNYHYYNAYAFLEHRLGFDIAPAQRQSYYNPLLDLPFYWMARTLTSKTVGFILGYVQGLNASLIFLIFWNITRFHSDRLKYLLGAWVIVMSVVAPGFLSELGTTFNDNITSLFVLGSVLLLLGASQLSGSDKPKTKMMTLLAGLIMGMGIGLKPNIIYFAASSAIGLVFLFKGWRLWLEVLFCYVIGGIAGGIATDGYWAWVLWSHYGNPVFPYFNQLFHSLYALPLSFADQRFLPANIWEYFYWPIVFSWNTQRVNEIKFVDIRFALLYILIVLWFVRLLLGWLNNRKSFDPAKERLFRNSSSEFFLVFAVTSFVLWTILFSIYRYLIPLELLFPIVAAITLEHLIVSKKVQIAAAASLSVLILIMFAPPSWGRTAWSDPYISVNTSSFDRADKSIVIMLGSSPTAYVIPLFPSGMRFVRVDGNLELTHQTLFYSEIKNLLSGPQGYEFYALFNTIEITNPAKNLSKADMRVNIDYCVPLSSNLPDKLVICRLHNR